ncbi:MAG: hypothetical protein FD155_814 [Bacteroidetes bacterium]|nr:MAG: hypothetical protein FD155_814 [Bacteroidota bacterium]
MKKVYFAVIIILVVSLQTKAQSFNGGIKAGLVVSQIAGDGFSGFNKVGLNGGFFVQYYVKPVVSLQMELAYIQKGSANTLNPDDPESVGYLLRMNYVELPLLIQYHLNPLVLELGLSMDFLAGQSEKINSQPNDQGDAWRKLNIASVIGLQYHLSEKWSASIRSINSINSIRKESVPLNVRRYSKKFGAFNDVIAVSLLFYI